jgi:sugar/nucleoside kinase (ribokinase family)
VVGNNFERKYINLFKRKGIDVEGLEIKKEGKTFHWKGSYEGAMNQAITHSTCLNVFATFQPNLNSSQKKAEYIFLANIDPELQLHVLSQLRKPKVVVCDTMNFWITGRRDELVKVLKKSDIILLNDQEVRQLVDESSLHNAAVKVLKLTGARWVIIKKGEHGAVIYSREGQFVAPPFPTTKLKDPTGAGDTFAGGLVGWLAHRRRVDESTVRQAALIGSALASYNIEAFSVSKIARLNHQQIVGRVEFLQNMLKCPVIKIPKR